MLSRDEQVVMHLRTHIKSLIGVILILFLASALLGIGLALIPEQYKPWTTWVLLGLYLIAIIWFVLKPWLLWLSATYTVTNRRIITRKGIFNKTGHDFPLRSINNVNYESSFLDRIFGCGTLILETAAEKPLTLPDVPGVERVHVVIADLIFDGEPDPE
jgi:membrane-flanked domain protein